MDPLDPATAHAALWFYSAVFAGWLASAGARGFTPIWTLSRTENRGTPP